ncbi:hypothetical protein FBUS_06960, partial [Fasciolopsis buskii]
FLHADAKCDGYFDKSGIHGCDNCFLEQDTHGCGMTMVSQNGARISLFIRIISNNLKPGIRVYDTQSNMTLLDATVEDKGYYFFRSSGTTIYIRFPAKQWGCISHKFGIMINPTKDKNKIKLNPGCVSYLRSPVTIQIPKKQAEKGQSMECAWVVFKQTHENAPITVRLSKCIPGDEQNCYLRYIRIFDGHGENKIKMNRINDIETTKYTIKSNTVIIEYYGFPALGDILIKVDNGRG